MDFIFAILFWFASSEYSNDLVQVPSRSLKDPILKNFSLQFRMAADALFQHLA